MAGGMASDGSFFQIVAGHRANPQRFDRLHVRNYLRSTFRGVPRLQFGADRSGVDECIVEDALHMGMTVQRAD